MKKIIFILALILLVPFATAAAQETALDPAKDPKGFMGYSWGSPLAEIVEKEDLIFIESKPLQNDELKIYKLPLEEGHPFQITFVFFEDKLVSGVFLVRPENKSHLLELTQQGFGPYSYESKDGTYYWEFPETRIIGLSHEDSFTVSFGSQAFYKSQKPL